MIKMIANSNYKILRINTNINVLILLEIIRNNVVHLDIQY